MSGPQQPLWNTGTGYQPAPPRRNPGKIFALVGALVLVVALIAVGIVVLLDQSGDSGTRPPVASPSSVPPASPTAPGTPSFPGQPALSQVFPDVAGGSCQASAEVRTRDGVTASEGYVCDFSSVAPGAQVIFARWADNAGAQGWYEETENLGPRIENFQVWRAGGVEQGPLYTAEAEGRVYSTGIYRGLNYSWEIRTTTLQESNAVFDAVQLRPRTSFGG